MVNADFTPGPTITIADGRLRGITDGKLNAWRGIPFAAPPVGPLRWRAPQPVKPWDGVREAGDFRNAPPQPPRAAATSLGKYQPISEDCLTLNVLAPATPATKPRPVMVFIYGGGYLVGTSATPLYLGNSLAQRGEMIYVSINYRLGALGYLDLTRFSTPDRPYDSNLGLRDQVAALEWVQRNIAAFGGDPDCVTIFGESAGGNAVTTLLATPAANGLFHRAIAQSSAPGLTVGRTAAQLVTDRFVEQLGATSLSGRALTDRLDAATPAELGKITLRLVREAGKQKQGIPLLPFGPVIDGDFLPEDPAAAIAAGRGAKVPLIIGTNRTEANLFTKIPGNKPSPGGIEQGLLAGNRAAAAAITASYRGYPDRRACGRIIGDAIFWGPSVQIAEAHSKHAPAYFYRFDYAPKTMKASGFGATHASELLAVFGVYRGGLGRTLAMFGDRKAALNVTDEMQRDWIFFARKGVPASDWPKYGTSARTTKIIDEHSYLVHDPAAQQRRAWTNYYSTLPAAEPSQAVS
jgi:para-nitrobenzyl esterase